MKNNKNRVDLNTTHLARRSHDVHGGYVSSLATGPIVPQYFDILGPGDSVHYRTKCWARFQDLVTAFKGEVDIHLDYFFVPLQMLYTAFGQVFGQTDDFISSWFTEVGTIDTDNFPVFKPTPFNPTAASLAGPRTSCKGFDFMRLADALDANPYFACGPECAEQASYTGSRVNPDFCNMPAGVYWPFLAYQAIYQKHFRNDEFERLSVSSYNIDRFYNNALSTLEEPFILRYCQRPSDYFTSVRVSPLASAVNKQAAQFTFPADGGALTGLLSKVNSFLLPNNNSANNGFGFQLNGGLIDNTSEVNSFEANGFTNYSRGSSASTDISYLNTGNIRALFAIDKYTRIYGRADKTYDDQILAHFGIKIPHDVKHDLTHLKHYHLVLQSSPVYITSNTANSDDSQALGLAGQVGGQGECSLDSDMEKFTAPVHGVFMCVAYAVTKPRYTQTFSKLNLLNNRLSFPIPEFDKLGAQPLYAYEVDRRHLRDDDLSWRIGWQNRYQEFKKKFNRASFIYEDPQPRGIWDTENVFMSWVLSRKAFGYYGSAQVQNHMIDARYMFENPENMNPVMRVPFNGQWFEEVWDKPWLALQTDPIIFEFACFAKKVSWMSETGEPDL